MLGTVEDVLHEMLKSFDKHYSEFGGWGENNNDVITKWANVADVLLKNLEPASTKAKEARETFIKSLEGLGYGVPFIPLMQAALTSYAIVLASGIPIEEGVGVPPPVPPVLVLGPPVEYGAPVFAVWAVAWVTWAKTGVVIKDGVPINWN